MVIFNFRGGSRFYFRPILHSFPTELKNLQRTKTILRDRVPFYQEKEAIFEVILSTCSEFSQIGTPHFSLEGVFCNLLDIVPRLGAGMRLPILHDVIRTRDVFFFERVEF